jgi:hypothetical protein
MYSQKTYAKNEDVHPEMVSQKAWFQMFQEYREYVLRPNSFPVASCMFIHVYPFVGA